ncbi:MAG: glycosyltransferase [Candidatus Lokiarchaeota archaeon]|nr:glycosyltransferase [Candidatus Lokiarchaeota archaeon]MBD3212949.1 glycosyltransferase [Candidatus Lokiarchaeota archaeon]
MKNDFQDSFLKSIEDTEHEISSKPNSSIDKRPKISIVIPLYNEEKTIKKVLKKIPNDPYYEIIVVDDGSIDNGIKKITELNDNRIRIISHSTNIGYGAAIKTGVKYSCGEIVVTIDSDGQHDPSDISKLIKPIIQDKADLVIGSRYLGNCCYKVPLYTRLGESVINLVLRLLFRQKVKNNQSGLRAFKKENDYILERLKNKGMGFTTEMLFQSGFNKLRIKEIPITVFPRKFGVSYVNLIKIVKSISFCITRFLFKKLFSTLFKSVISLKKSWSNLISPISFFNKKKANDSFKVNL